MRTVPRGPNIDRYDRSSGAITAGVPLLLFLVWLGECEYREMLLRSGPNGCFIVETRVSGSRGVTPPVSAEQRIKRALPDVFEVCAMASRVCLPGTVFKCDLTMRRPKGVRG